MEKKSAQAELSDPIQLFAEWFAEAKASATSDPTMMTLATATPAGKPSIRTVLLKAFDARGFVFYTNLRSRKAQELEQNNQAALCFYWPVLDKQIRIEGTVEPVSKEEADSYFASRPRGRQIGAWASKQSQLMQNPDELLERVQTIEKKFGAVEIPRPAFWSGFRVKPERIEFWQQGEHRLHNRICFIKNNGGWEVKYLFP